MDGVGGGGGVDSLSPQRVRGVETADISDRGNKDRKYQAPPITVIQKARRNQLTSSCEKRLTYSSNRSKHSDLQHK